MSQIKPLNRNTLGVGIFHVMFIVFLVLKLFKVNPVANWSWWWVTAPLWGISLLLLIVLLIQITISKLKK